MNDLSVLIKPVSSACNMRCKYCFYLDESSCRDVKNFGTMSVERAERILRNLFTQLNAGDHLSIAFQGGEPTLAGLAYFRAVTELATTLAGETGTALRFSLQTNGLLLNREWCHFLQKNAYLIGLSIDGPKVLHDSARVDGNACGTFDRVMAAKELLDQAHLDYNVLMTLTSDMARAPDLLWAFILKENLQYIQFTPCLDGLSGKNGFSLTPALYASFYCRIFDLWNEAQNRGKQIHVKLFDDIMSIAETGRCETCGLTGQCRPQLIVEADGGVYPCDFYVLNRYYLGNLSQQPVWEIWSSLLDGSFSSDHQTRSALCDACEYWIICGGGCKRMRREVFGLSNTICGQKLLLNHILDG